MKTYKYNSDIVNSLVSKIVLYMQVISNTYFIGRLIPQYSWVSDYHSFAKFSK